MHLVETNTVRFAALVKECGQPALYLPLTDPETDPQFMRAVKQDRVVTLKEDPSSHRKAFGIVGFLKEPFVRYLLFPKPLKNFENHRVIGIKYDALGEATVTASVPALPKKLKQGKTKPEKPKPEPKRFRAQVRLTATVTQEVVITAMNPREAKARAENQAKTGADFRNASVTAKVTRVDPAHD